MQLALLVVVLLHWLNPPVGLQILEVFDVGVITHNGIGDALVDLAGLADTLDDDLWPVVLEALGVYRGQGRETGDE